MKNDLANLTKQHADAITLAESLPVGSPERAVAMKAADRIVQAINDLHERANPTPNA